MKKILFIVVLIFVQIYYLNWSAETAAAEVFLIMLVYALYKLPLKAKIFFNNIIFVAMAAFITTWIFFELYYTVPPDLNLFLFEFFFNFLLLSLVFLTVVAHC